MKSIKKKEGATIDKFSPRKKEEGKESTNIKSNVEQPNNGRELFFSNVLMKVYQVPSVFHRNSEEELDENLSSFIVLFYEKSMRKRTFAKSQTQKQRLTRQEEIKRACVVAPNIILPRILEELLPNRDSKMRRFCNYFLTLFNQKKLNPFT